MIKKAQSKPRLSIPQFLYKTFELVENVDTQDICCWSENGDSFIIKNINMFCDKILTNYFKTNNLASFVRQLNMYGFNKVRNDENLSEFKHKYFKKDQKHLLSEIKRKQTVGGPQTSENGLNQNQEQDKLQQQEDSLFEGVVSKQEYIAPQNSSFSPQSVFNFGKNSNNNLDANPSASFGLGNGGVSSAYNLENNNNNINSQKNLIGNMDFSQAAKGQTFSFNATNSQIAKIDPTLDFNQKTLKQFSSQIQSQQNQSQISQLQPSSNQSQDILYLLEKQKSQTDEIEKLKTLHFSSMRDVDNYGKKLSELERAMTVLISQHDTLISENRHLWDEIRRNKEKDEKRTEKIMYTLMYFFQNSQKQQGTNILANPNISLYNQNIQVEKQNGDNSNGLIQQTTSEHSIHTSAQQENEDNNNNEKSKSEINNINHEENNNNNSNQNESENNKEKQGSSQVKTEDWSTVRHIEKNGEKIPVCHLKVKKKRKEENKLNQNMQQIMKGILTSNDDQQLDQIIKQSCLPQQSNDDLDQQMNNLLSKRMNPIQQNQIQQQLNEQRKKFQTMRPPQEIFSVPQPTSQFQQQQQNNGFSSSLYGNIQSIQSPNNMYSPMLDGNQQSSYNPQLMNLIFSGASSPIPSYFNGNNQNNLSPINNNNNGSKLLGDEKFDISKLQHK